MPILVKKCIVCANDAQFQVGDGLYCLYHSAEESTRSGRPLLPYRGEEANDTNSIIKDGSRFWGADKTDETGYACPNCEVTFEGSPTVRTAYVGRNVIEGTEENDWDWVLFENFDSKRFYVCDDGCVNTLEDHQQEPKPTTLWQCRNCNSKYADEDTANKCCRIY